ncbi:MAG: sulfotransferase [Gammaproteobacteria bacterium]
MQIQEKSRYPLAPASVEDFRFVEAEAIEPQSIVEQRNISLYCLDDLNRRAIFVETTQGVELSRAPFFYQAQFDHAQSLVSAPYSILLELAKEMPDPGENLIMLYSVGRCGSTLLSKAFEKIDGTLSLSEPDVFCDIALLCEPDGSREQDLRDILWSSVRLLCKPGVTIDPERYVLKPRPQAIHYAALFNRMFPKARLVFLYRDAVDFICSFARFREDLRHTVPELQSNLDYYRKVVPLIEAYAELIDYEDPVMDFYILWWLSCVESCLKLQRLGIPIFVLRYEELRRDPRGTLAALFDHCGLAAKIENALEAFQRDSQADSVLARDKQRRLDPAERSRLRIRVQDFLGRHPEIDRPDFIIPDVSG